MVETAVVEPVCDPCLGSTIALYHAPMTLTFYITSIRSLAWQLAFLTLRSHLKEKKLPRRDLI